MTNWHQTPIEEVVKELNSSLENGLNETMAAASLAELGPNELTEVGLQSPLAILWAQFTSSMALILLGAATLSALLGEAKDAIAIGAIVVLFALLGFVQEYRAERAMAALKRMAAPVVKALRDGNLRQISARNLAPGDIIWLEAGNLVPADARLFESSNLRALEAALTGESEPVDKDAQMLPPGELALGDRRNMIYMGSTITYGRGKAIVTATGMRSELGKVASLLQEVSTEITPLQRRLDQLGKLLAVVGVIVAGFVLIGGLLIDEPLGDMLLTAVSIAVAIIPEGLPAVVTITLALGAQRMLKRRALIRKLPAVETLGSVTVICTDKTGTLTENRMTVVALDVAGERIEISPEMRNRNPALLAPTGEQSLPVQRSGISLLLAGGALCNDASLVISSDHQRMQTLGDPTEGALLLAAANYGLSQDALNEAFPRFAEVPFDSNRKRMTTVHTLSANSGQDFPSLAIPATPETQYLAFTKGAVDGLLGICSQVWLDGTVHPLDNAWQARIERANDDLAQQGMRVLGVAYQTLSSMPEQGQAETLEKNLTLVGLVGMIDPPRPEVKHAVATCRAAGIRPVMITGDHPLTARQIARELSIIQDDEQDAGVVTGVELNRMTDEQLSEAAMRVSVFARVSPEDKLRIVAALQGLDQIVAMTGDGVNDAPALKRANIGVAMGIAGSDVAKEAAEMVLQDDNFATIVSAIEEGRTIYDNLRKFIRFSVAGNIGKVSVMLLAPLLGKPLPLEPLQLLWLNLLTDGLLGLGLSLEPPEKDNMQRPPYSPQAGFFSGSMYRQVLWVGALIGALALGLGYLYWRVDPNSNWQSMTFATLAFSQMAQALASRSRRDSFFQIGIRSNLPGAALAILVFGLQLAVLYLPAFQSIFNTRPLSPTDLGISLGLSSLVFIAIELEKWFARRKNNDIREKTP
jgi:Ca2+-transporting ATPase